MVAIEDCSKAINNLGNGNGGKEIRKLIQIKQRAMQCKVANATSPPIKTGVPASSRVPLYTNNPIIHTITSEGGSFHKNKT